MRYILAHDVGTTGNKATLYDAEGRLVRAAFVPYETSFPLAGWAEQDPADWWRSLCLSTRQLLAESGVRGQDVACVCFSGQMMGMVAVDSAAHPLHKAIIWADQRSVGEVAAVAGRIEPRQVYAITGHRLSASYSGGKILWLKAHRPDLYAQTHRFLQAKDYLAATLTGVFATDHSDASGTNLYSLEDADWSPSLLHAFGIPRQKLPDVRRSTDVIGGILPAVADQVGLPAGTPVAIGGGDGSCAATGAGVIRPGTAYNYIGSSSWIGVATPHPILDPEQRTFTWVHLVPGLFTPTGTMQAAGSSYQWARDELAQPEAIEAAAQRLSPYALMDRQVTASPPGASGLLFLPYLLGERSPRWNPEARGAFIGLTIRHRHADLLRAVLEGITFNLRVILEAFSRQGAQIASLRLIGGGAASAVWNTIMADIFGLPVQRLTLLEEATSMGAAVAGGIGVGLWPGFSQVDRMIGIAGETRPNPARLDLYNDLYTAFNRSYAALEAEGIFSILAGLPVVPC